MLLAIDVGNTQTVLGLFDCERLRADWRIATRKEVTSDELGTLLSALFRESKVDRGGVDGVVISSVVPDWNSVWTTTAKRYFTCDPLFVGPGIRTGMPILYENPHEVGADRIVNSVAAAARHGCPVIVLDFGTATTFDVVNERGEYLGGVIAPGPGVSAEALFTRAARLHRVDLCRPPRVIGRTTEQSLQAGLFLGYVALIEGLVKRIQVELGVEAPVIATGGLAPVFAPELPWLKALEPHLTLEGLRLLWDRNRR